MSAVTIEPFMIEYLSIHPVTIYHSTFQCPSHTFQQRPIGIVGSVLSEKFQKRGGGKEKLILPNHLTLSVPL